MTHHKFEPKITNKNGKQISITNIKEIKSGFYSCHCQKCDIDFFVCEDFPFHVQQHEMDDQVDLLPDVKEYYGLSVFEVFCPRCGQKLMFSLNQTPIGDLEWRER